MGRTTTSTTWRAVAALLVLLGALAVGASPASAAERPSPGTATAYGAATDLGPPPGGGPAGQVVDIDTTPSGDGYWLTAATGAVHTFGNARFFGSMGGVALNQPIVAMAGTPSGEGYWLAAADGGMFTFGDARFFGSMGDVALNQPIVAMASTPTGEGYWLAAADGGMFTFGDARFFGSMGDVALNQPIVAMTATPSGEGYWLAAADGGIFTFGDARFFGSSGGQPLGQPVVGMAAAPGGGGYWLATRDGQVLEHGVAHHGSAADSAVGWREAPTTAIAAHPDGGYWLAHGQRTLLEPDDQGPAVAALQQRLQDLGYWIGTVDGTYGQLTEQAVYAFQKYEGLDVDGLAGSSTRAALEQARRPQARATSGDVIEVDKARQLVFVVRDGQTLWTYNTSTGDDEPYTYEGETYIADTPNGSYEVFRQIDGWRESHLGRLYRPKYFTYDGIALHGYSFVPPYPTSHGCVRVTNAAIDFIWAEGLAPIGIDVEVYGEIPI